MESCLPFVSYAQNFEDVMLWRALKHIEKGVYVDVGAQHPIIDSVSKAFYERGWRGIHIEPVPHYAELLRKDRPDETVLQVALADSEGTLELNVIPDTGLSTAVDAYAQHHQLDRGYELNRIQVPVLTLKSALKSLEGKDVHWLKIDVEGFEEQVLRGWDSQILRPWVMVVEATVPNSPETSYASWDPILTAANYKFVYFDGLNRFYVANEHAELAEAYSCPPNVFDGVELSGLASWGLCRGLIVAHQTREEALHTQNARLVTELNSAGEVHAQLQAHAQWLQNVWDAAKQRVEELSQRTGRLESELGLERQLTARQGVDLQAAREHESRLQAHAQWLQNVWDAAKQRVEELSQRTGRLESELGLERQLTARQGVDLQAAREDEIRLQAHAEWLQNVWDAAKQRVEELSQRTGRLESELGLERQLTARQGVDLQAAREHESRLQDHAQWLQNVWDAAKQRVEELSQRTGRLESELGLERQLTARQGVDLQAAREDEIRLQAHAQWLQNEWDAAKAKIDELNHSSHHWWTMADAFNKELQAVYAGKSWRITWPLRRANQAAKWVLMLLKRTVRWLLRLPVSLLSFTVRSGLIGGSGTSSPKSCPAEPGTSAEQSAEVTPLQIMQTELPKSLSPHAARIYADLQKDLAVRKS